MPIQKSIIIVSAGIMQIPAIQKAKKLGYHVIATDKNEKAEGFKYSDVSVVIDSKDVNGHLEYVRSAKNIYNICGAFAASDVAVTVAAITNELGLPGISNEVALLSHHKAMMKKKWIEDGIPTPYGVEIKNIADIDTTLDKFTFPLIVKPVDNAASRGSRRVDTLDELKNAISHALEISRSKTAIVEEYVFGYEQSVETIIYNGIHHHVGMADRFFGYHPYHIETAHVDPSQLSIDQQSQIFSVVDAAAQSLGINFGPAKADMIWTQKGPMILEMTARLSGGFHSQYTTPLSTGQDPISAVLDMCAGNPLNQEFLQKNKNNIAICSGYFPDPGKIKDIKGLNDALAVEGVEKIIINRKIGDIIKEYVDNGERVCWIITSGKTIENAKNSFISACQKLRIITQR